MHDATELEHRTSYAWMLSSAPWNAYNPAAVRTEKTAMSIYAMRVLQYFLCSSGR
jgi:hypothetical protein